MPLSYKKLFELMEQKGVAYVQHDVPEVHLGKDA